MLGAWLLYCALWRRGHHCRPRSICPRATRTGKRMATVRLSDISHSFSQLTQVWWSGRGSNPRPLHCQAREMASAGILGPAKHRIYSTCAPLGLLRVFRTISVLADSGRNMDLGSVNNRDKLQPQREPYEQWLAAPSCWNCWMNRTPSATSCCAWPPMNRCPLPWSTACIAGRLRRLQRDALLALDCTLGQGYLYSRPNRLGAGD